MARIFNALRRHLLAEGQLTRYLAYAAGEIVLVVAGILIALQINTWNANRQRGAALREVLQVVREDLALDTAEVGEIVTRYEAKRPLYMRVLRDSATAADYVDSFAYRTLIMNYSPIVIERRGYELLRERASGGSSPADSLAGEIATFYSAVIDLVGEARRKVTDDYLANVGDWKERGTVLSGLREPSPETVAYFTKSLDYDGRVWFHYSLVYNNYLPTLEAFREGATELLTAIDAELTED